MNAHDSLALDPTATYVPVNCPRCGGSSAEQRYHLVVSWIVTCADCGLSYVNPRVSEDELSRKLQLWADQDVVDGERLAINFAEGNLTYCRRLLERLADPTANRDRLLDVGCGTGAMLQVAQALGWRGAGIEIGHASCAYARETLGLDVEHGSLYELEPTHTYDAVAMVEVIEHLSQPVQALQKIHNLLEPGGQLLVTTPNFDSLYRRLFGSRWWVINCEDEHIVLFNLETLTGILEENGFEVIDWHIQGFDLMGLLRTLRGRVASSAQQQSEAEDNAVEGYREARSTKARLRSFLDRIGLLTLARAMLRGLAASFSLRWSPTFAWGDQLVVVARR